MKRQIGAEGAASAGIHPAHPAAPVDMVPAGFIAPMLAGARARGIVDAYEMMALGTILLDESGRVLHTSERAKSMMQGMISIVSEHMVGATAAANSVIEALIARGLSGSEIKRESAVLESLQGKRLSLSAVPVPEAPELAVQLLKSVVVLSLE